MGEQGGSETDSTSPRPHRRRILLWSGVLVVVALLGTAAGLFAYWRYAPPPFESQWPAGRTALSNFLGSGLEGEVGYGVAYNMGAMEVDRDAIIEDVEVHTTANVRLVDVLLLDESYPGWRSRDGWQAPYGCKPLISSEYGTFRRASDMRVRPGESYRVIAYVELLAPGRASSQDWPVTVTFRYGLVTRQHTFTEPAGMTIDVVEDLDEPWRLTELLCDLPPG